MISHPADCNLDRSLFFILFIIPTTFNFLLFNSETRPTEEKTFSSKSTKATKISFLKESGSVSSSEKSTEYPESTHAVEIFVPN